METVKFIGQQYAVRGVEITSKAAPLDTAMDFLRRLFRFARTGS